MKKILTCILLAALVLALGVPTVYAAGYGRHHADERPRCPAAADQNGVCDNRSGSADDTLGCENPVDGNGNGVCDGRVDENNDGICDSRRDCPREEEHPCAPGGHRSRQQSHHGGRGRR